MNKWKIPAGNSTHFFPMLGRNCMQSIVFVMFEFFDFKNGIIPTPTYK